MKRTYPAAAHGVDSSVSPITSEAPGSFPWSVWHDRHPVLLTRIRDAHPISREQAAGFDALLEETLTGPMTALPAGAAGKHQWDRWGEPYFGKSWLEVPFLWAESYFYRRLLEVTGYFGDGAWRGLDPFIFLKQAELTTDALRDDLAALDALAMSPPRERTRLVLDAALWGNQAYLGFRMATGHADIERSSHLVADDTTGLEPRLAAGLTSVIVVADNAGRELLADLVLIDHLLANRAAAVVRLHLKPSPYYVSDATTADLASCLRALHAAGSQARAVAVRLREACVRDQLQVTTHGFYGAPLSFHHMPADLAAAFSEADLVIMKGDLNYRRLVGDYHWHPATSFAEVASYFPAPVVALRTLKSDVVVGVDSLSVLQLDEQDPSWRVNGKYALVQAHL